MCFYLVVKQRSVKLKQDSCEDGVCFAAFKGKELETSKSRRRIPVKAISIDALSPNKFLILDSDGGLQILHLFSPIIGSDITTFLQQLPSTMKVQKVAVLSEIAASMLLLSLPFYLFYLCSTEGLLNFQGIIVVKELDDGLCLLLYGG